jgi:hypothetical protein
VFQILSIVEEWKEFVIGVRLEDSSGKIWDDAVSFRFYRNALSLGFASDSSGNAPVVIMPDTRIVPAAWGNFRVPFATTGYKVVLSGATMDTELKCSISVESALESTSTFINPNSYEPNNSADAASTIGMQQAVVSYLAFNDLDFWSIDTSFPKQTRLHTRVPGTGACVHNWQGYGVHGAQGTSSIQKLPI